jgi:hypothetical protein
MSHARIGLLVGLGALAPIAAADVFEYKFLLTGCAEVPSVDTDATGTVLVVVDTDTGEVKVEGEYNDLQGEATAAHIHSPASKDETAGISLALVVSGGNSGTVTGSGVVNDVILGHILDGLAYINVHSTKNAPGEIRGQIVPFCPGDHNCDGVKNILDFVDFQANWVAEDCSADANGDNAFNILDFVAFQGLFQQDCN